MVLEEVQENPERFTVADGYIHTTGATLHGRIATSVAHEGGFVLYHSQPKVGHDIIHKNKLEASLKHEKKSPEKVPFRP